MPVTAPAAVFSAGTAFRAGRASRRSPRSSSPSWRLLDGVGPVNQGEPVHRRQDVEHRLRPGVGGDGGGQVLGHFRRRRAGVGGFPAAVRLGAVDGGAAGRGHPAGGLEAPDPLHIPRGPHTFRAPAGHPLERALVVPAPALAVDPAETQGLLQGGLVVQLRHRAALLVQHQPHTGALRVVALQPRAPLGGILHQQFLKFTSHGTILLRTDPRTPIWWDDIPESRKPVTTLRSNDAACPPDPLHLPP